MRAFRHRSQVIILPFLRFIFLTLLLIGCETTPTDSHLVAVPFGTHKVDVRGLEEGELAVDPWSGGVFVVPQKGEASALAATEAEMAAYSRPLIFRPEAKDNKTPSLVASPIEGWQPPKLTEAAPSKSAEATPLAVETKPPVEKLSTDRYYDFNYRPSVGHHYVEGYYRKDGTYVRSHYRTDPDSSFWNNWSSKGNVNPFTGQIGTKLPSR